MKDVFKNYRNYVVRGTKQGLVSRGKFSLKKMDIKFDEILDKFLPKFAQAVEIKLPKLKKLGEKSNVPKIKIPKLKKLGDTVNV